MYKHRQAGGKLPPSNDDAAVEACLRRLRLQDDQGVIRAFHRHTSWPSTSDYYAIML